MDLSTIVFRSLFLIYCQLCFSVNGYDIYDVEQLKIDIFNTTNYDTSVRPIINQSNALQVDVQLGISSILDIDFSTGKLDYTGFILAMWQDEKLIWNSTQYGGLTQLKLDMSEIWNPEIVQLDMIGELTSTNFAFVENTGIVTMVTNSELYSLCEFINQFYECSIVLFSSNPSSQVNIVPLTDSVNLANFKGNGKWRWDSTGVNTETIHISEVNGINVTINSIVNTIRVDGALTICFIHKYIPLYLITFTSYLYYLVPLNSIDRLEFSMTVLLALVFWQALVSDVLPKYSSNVSILSMFMITTLCQNTLSIAITVFLYRLSKIETTCRIPNWLCGLVAWTKQKKCKEAQKPSSVEQGPNLGSFVDPDNDDVCTYDINTRVRGLDITWLEVAKCLDKIFFCVQLVIIVIILFITAFIYNYRISSNRT